MTPKIIAYRKNRHENIKTERDLVFRRALRPLQVEVGDTVYLARRLNSPKSEGQVFEIYTVVIEEAKWSKIRRIENPTFKPQPSTYFGKSRFIVEKI